MAADAAVDGIREADADGSVGLIGREEDPPYDRPPLSKGLWIKTSEKGWLNWEIQKESDRAHAQDRKPLFTRNVFKAEETRYSSPNAGRHKTVAEVQNGRRLFVEETDAMLEAAGPRVHFLFHLCRVLGLRP